MTKSTTKLTPPFSSESSGHGQRKSSNRPPPSPPQILREQMEATARWQTLRAQQQMQESRQRYQLNMILGAIPFLMLSIHLLSLLFSHQT